MAYGLAGRLSVNPLADPLTAPDGKTWRLAPPRPAPELPPAGFVTAAGGYVPPAAKTDLVQVRIDKASKRLAALAPFAAPRFDKFSEMPVLMKTRGKTTTDHISPAGAWLRFRGHLDAISDNMLTGATNAFSGERGVTIDQTTGERGKPVPAVARRYKAAGLNWVIVGDENYGEGSSREHAAMSPRHLGAVAVIARSFARIHETNLKKQGILPLTFVHAADYDRVRETDRVTLADAAVIEPGKRLSAVVLHADGSRETIELAHTLNREQIAWFRAGSALNVLREREEKKQGTSAGRR
jgi:aconitate hydratase